MDHRTTSPAGQRIAPLCGVYRITNSVTGDSYIGSSAHIHRRWAEHRNALTRGRHDNVRLTRAWPKYGADAFTFTIIEECPRTALVDVEQRDIDAERPSYNLAPKAGQGPGMAGKKHSEATRAKLRAVVFTEERRAKLRATRPGIWTPEMRERLRLAHLGRKRSPAAIAAQIAAMQGHPVSDETRRKLSMVHRGKKHGPHTTETVAAMTAFQRARRAREKAEGKPRSEAERRHLDEMHAQMRGRRQPITEIENRRAALKAGAERRRLAQPAGLLTSAEAAAWLSVAEGTVRRWMREGRLAACKTPCGRMVAQSDLAALLVQLHLFPD